LTERRPTRLARPPERPLPADQLPVPPQERFQSDDEHRPQRSGQAPTGRDEQEPVRAMKGRPLHLSAQHLDLMPEHEQFDVAVLACRVTSAQEAAWEEVWDRELNGS